MTESDSARDLAVEFRALNDHLRDAGDAETAMQQLVDLARKTVSGCDWAAITAWPLQRRPWTRSYAGDVAGTVDQLQYDVGEGPCLTAAETHEPVHVPDLAQETRWPKFCEAAVAEGSVGGIMSFYLTGEPDRLALNLYAAKRDVFDTDAFNAAALFAAHAGVLSIHADSAHDAATLSQALNTNRQIGAAIGILMSAHKVTEDDAFQMLRVVSQHLNRKLRDIAHEVTETGELPT